MKLTAIALIHAAEQALRDALDWHRANAPKITEARLIDFQAGYSEGWRAACAHIRLHGGVIETDAQERKRRFAA